MSRLSSISSNPVLKEFAQGAAQDAIMPVADFLALAKGREGDLRQNHGPDLDWSIQQLAAKMKPKPKRKPSRATP